MAEHENTTGETDEWYTPPDLLEAIGAEFDLDPCSPSRDHWVPAKRVFTKEDDGLNQDWGDDYVFMNPPFGGRNGHLTWLSKFLDHGNGIAIVRAYTSAGWFHDQAICADAFLFPRGKTKFVRPDGSIGKQPGHGIVLIAMGDRAKTDLLNADIGWFVDNAA